ncbi:hypothetical protein [Dongia mobilis]|uniref:hypothetical protein n=1 Tax=Dongia sp. TaxID=1977262 RepID=UPI0026F07BE4
MKQAAINGTYTPAACDETAFRSVTHSENFPITPPSLKHGLDRHALKQVSVARHTAVKRNAIHESAIWIHELPLAGAKGGIIISCASAKSMKGR